MMKFVGLAVVLFLSLTASASLLRGDQSLPSSSESVNDVVRKLLVDADRSKRCFEDGSNKGLSRPHDADFYENPWLRNADRGDWGKCLPEEVFGVLCVHETAHGTNDGNYQPSDGPMHDAPAQLLFLKLQELHDKYCVHVDVKIPDDVQEKFNDFFFARNMYALGGPSTGGAHDFSVVVEPFNVSGVVRKKYVVNGVRQPVLSMTRGSTYVFDQSDPSNVNHPLLVRISTNIPAANVVRVGTPGSTGAQTTITVADDAPDEMTYYCEYHEGMGTTITVNEPSRRLHDITEITYEMACEGDYSQNPRMALQMGLYCLLGFLDQSIDTSLVRRAYGLSKTCDTIMRHGMRHQNYPEVYYPPYGFCNSNAVEDTCAVHPYIRTDGVNTCSKYCESFEGLECKSAAVNHWGDPCNPLRGWSCDEPAMDNNLLCTCGAAPAAPEHTNPLSNACAKQLLPSSNPPRKFCGQDMEEDTCTTVSYLRNYENDTCDSYCLDHGLECVAAWDDSGCVGFKEYSCDDAASSYMLCTCRSPAVEVDESTVTPNCEQYCALENKVCLSASSTPVEDCLVDGSPCQDANDFATQLEYVCGEDIERPDVVDEMNTETCNRMAFMRDVVTRPTTYCPPNTLSPAENDTCTVLANVYHMSSDLSGRTCDAFCESFPGLKCVAAADEQSNQCVVREQLQCSDPKSSDLLCTCAIDESAMTAANELSDTVIGPACENMALSSTKYKPRISRVCESHNADNTCTVVAYLRDLDVRSCDEFCDSYHGMECVAASEDRYGTCTVQSSVECSSVTTGNDLLCTCGFKTNSSRSEYFDMAPVFEQNAVRTCPAYDNAINSEGKEYHTNENQRSYDMVVLGLDVDEESGAPKVTDINVRKDFSNSDLDTYNTAHVEACDGLESLIREGDPEEKCSFGHRLDKSQNCYGKVYGQNYEEASAACEARGGHIARVDSVDEFLLLKSIFGNQKFNIGLHDVGGRDWEWNGYPGESVDPYSSTYSSFPLASNEREDCVELNLGSNKMVGKWCFERETYLCEGVADSATGLGGDLLADEGGFCLWYLDDPDLELPDDESGGFQNTELAHFLLFDEDKTTRKYIELYDTLYSASGIRGHAENEANWDKFTYRLLGVDSDEPLVDKVHHDKDYHCHFSPTNFGMARIYIQQHMLERIYPGAMHKHCFCGYKHLGHFVTRCDCTRSGERNGQCQEHHRNLLFEETYRQTGEYVRCNNGNCDDASP